MTYNASTRPKKPHSELSHVKTWIFDLDNTLYRADADFFKQIDQKITAFIQRYLNVSYDKATHMRKHYWTEYGTTLSGLMALHDMDPAEFLDDVHDVDLSYLKPDIKLRQLIEKLPGRKLIFTNGSRGHAKNVGTHLNLLDLFDGSFGIEDTGYIPKPKRAAFEAFNSAFNVNPKEAIFFEDGILNLQVPKDMGMKTVLVTPDTDLNIHSNVMTCKNQDDTADWVDFVTTDLPLWLHENTAF